MLQELMTSEEFAEKLKIGRSTLFEWLEKGILLPGKHYFKQGRVLRFVWSDEVISHFMERSLSSTTNRTVSQPGTVGNKPPKPENRKKPGINLEY